MPTRFRLGINAGFAINRFPEPEVWLRIVGEELGLRYVQFVADLLNPFLPGDLREEQIGRLQAAAEKYGVRIDSTFTSAYTRVNHLMHPDAHTRLVWKAWFKEWALIAKRLGARGFGSHFGILSVTDDADPARRAERIAEAVKAWQELTWYARELGLEWVIFEPMSVPREMAITVEETEELLERVNAGAGAPFLACLDVGHAPHPSDRDPYRWLRRLGSRSPVVHLQQTEKDASRHWPFTPEYNRAGIVDPARVLAALEEAGAEDVVLLFEIGHREAWPTDFQVLDDLRASVQYWRRFVKE